MMCLPDCRKEIDELLENCLFCGKIVIRTAWFATLVTFLFITYTSNAMAQNEINIFEGVIYPVEERELAFPVSGLVASVKVDEGDHVQKGEPLLELDTSTALLESQRRRIAWENDTAIVTSRDRLRILDRQHQTLQTLLDASGSVSQDELDALQLERLQTKGQRESSKIQQALAELEYRLAAQALADMTLTAPIDGVITRIEKFGGEWISAGDTATILVDLSSVMLRVSIPDDRARLLKEGIDVPVTVHGNGPYSGKVTFISPVADPASGLIGIKILISNINSDIRPGSRATVQL